ncbi:MAG: pyruvate dehydrogenase complex dihydrolipoamide acetyltransferase [Rhizobiaceae bacterium]|jgi:pyruvate dehydrogenase E2 component (dihydrolipoamide acetyltransferase)|nr:pyruvate dehydrogenase complex dihydrolipoamide acetyltransferase [Rhizobiaceae bacterium]
MPITITMPALSPTMEEGNLAKWLKKEGDAIKSGDVIAEIETDKATMEVEAVDEGVLAKIVVPAGSEGVKVNTVIAVLAVDGEDVAAAAAKGGESSSGGKPAPISSLEGDMPVKPAEGGAVSAGQTPPSVAASSDISPSRGEMGTRVFASPLARRIAKDAGLDVAAITGSGPHGRVVKADVDKAIASGVKPSSFEAPLRSAPQDEGPKAAPAPIAKGTEVPWPKGPTTEQILKNFAEGSYELVKHDGMRKTIAKRLQESKQTIPHFYVSVDCELDALLALRTQLNAAAPDKGGKPAYKLSVNDMVIKALALALRDVPDANVSWTDEAMVKHKHADVGVAVSIPGGLITPIIRKAETLSLSAISNAMKDLGARAKDKKLKPEEYQGGTTAVSNMGMMGVKNFAAVVNPPHATILAVGAGEQRPVVKNGALAIATVMTVTLSTDHRCVDGALGAELLGVFKGYIENPMGMLV